MPEHLLWSIGSPDGRSSDLVDNYKEPNLLGDVVWRVPGSGQCNEQRWPRFHPSEADPEAGYSAHPYTIEFTLDQAPVGAYLLELHYLVIAPRLAHLEVTVNGTQGKVYLRPHPSQTGEIRLLSGLHTTIYSDGIAEVIIPASLLNQGVNCLELTAHDDGEVIHVDRIEAIKRLDRMANGAGFIYEYITFSHIPSAPDHAITKLDISPSVLYLKNSNGDLVERCHLYIELSRSIDQATLTLELRGQERSEQVSFDLPATAFGHLHYIFDLFDGEGAVEYTIRGEVGGQDFCRTGRLSRRRKWQVYLTPHAHTDIGYTHRQWEVAERLARNIDKALDLLDQDAGSTSASFTYHLDSSWALETWLATRSEERRRRLLHYIKAGRISLPHNYVDLLTQFAALEDLIRNGEFTEDYLRPNDMRANFASIVDVASITGSLPAILEGSGVKYLVHANNQDRGPFRLNGGLHRISPFYWEGSNGGRVLVWLAKMYCELRKVCGSPPVLSSAERGLELWLEEYETPAYAPDAVMLYGQEADNTDIDPQPAAFVQRWNETFAYPRLIPCDVSAFFEYIEQHFGSMLKTVRGDGGAYWEDGVGSTIVPAIQARAAQAMLPAAERLESLAVVHHPDWAYPAEHFDEAWRQLLLFDEHTWGAFLSCTDPDALLQHDQWETKERMAREAAGWAKRLLHTAAVRHSLSWNNDGREIVVYNPHSWTVSGFATVEIARGERVYAPLSGDEVPVRVVRTTSSQIIVELWVDQLAGLSYLRYVLKPGTAQTTEGVAAGLSGSEPEQIVLENSFYRLVLDLKRGCATSWFDKGLNRELVDTGDAWGLGKLLYAQGGEGTRLVSNQSDLPDGNPDILDEWNLLDFSLEHSALGVSLTATGRVPRGQLEVSWLLPANAKRVDVDYTYKKEETRAKEAVYVAFPLDLPDASVRSDSQLGWVNWNSDELPGGCKEWLPLQTGVLVSGEADVFIASPDIPLFCTGDIVRGRWPKELELSGGRIFSYVLNNYWHTNYKASQGGEIRFGYRLTSDRSIEPERAFRTGWEARQSLYAHRISFQDFRQVNAPYTRADGGILAQIGTEQVVLSTIKQAKWGEGMIIRLQEIAGHDQIAPVALGARRIARAWAVDLLERDLRELPVEPDGTLRVPVPAWGLATVRVVLEQVQDGVV